jgi:diaminopimelate epimerase
VTLVRKGGQNGVIMTQLHLTKHHGLGNDFLVLVDGDAVPESHRAELAATLCHRHTGIGADGLLFVLAADAGFDTRMRLHNADGSIAEMSGNGIRCFAQAAVMAGVVQPGTVRVQTDAGLRVVQVSETEPTTGVATVSVDMGAYGFDQHPVLGSGGHTVDVGNPHLVIPVDSLDDIDITIVGPDREAAYLTTPTNGINVHVVRAVDEHTIDMLVWERGVGATQACGTGATAVAGVMHRLGLVGRSVEVRQPGGSARVEIHSDRATLHGPSQFIAKITVQWTPKGAPISSPVEVLV